MPSFQKILPVIKNKYFILTFAFLVIVLFVDRNNFVSQVRLTRKLNKLKEDRIYYLQEIEKDRKALHDLQTNPKNLERFGRETYIMKKDNEDVFVIEEAPGE